MNSRIHFRQKVHYVLLRISINFFLIRLNFNIQTNGTTFYDSNLSSDYLLQKSTIVTHKISFIFLSIVHVQIITTKILWIHLFAAVSILVQKRSVVCFLKYVLGQLPNKFFFIFVLMPQ